MLPYTLAKQLKEAGFPQPKNYVGDTKLDIGELPTLSELIEVCGEKIEGLTRVEKMWLAGDITGEEVEYGKSPEEAVAKLWLKLNKK